jgi:hypothetical protein
MKSAAMVTLYARLVSIAKGVQVARYAPADIKRMMDVTTTTDHRGEVVYKAKAKPADPLGPLIVRGVNSVLRNGSMHLEDFELKPWGSVYNMCFLPRHVAPTSPSIFVAYQVNTSKVAGLLSMCRHYNPIVKKTVDPDRMTMMEELYPLGLHSKLTPLNPDGTTTLSTGTKLNLNSYMLIDIVFATNKDKAGTSGVGAVLVLHAIAAALRSRASPKVKGIMAVAMTTKSGNFFETLGFTQLVPRQRGKLGLWALAFDEMSIATMNVRLSLNEPMMTTVCVRRGVKNPDARMARC